MSDQELVDKMESVWRSIGELCERFAESEWKKGTDCPGWSVQDQVSHLVGTEVSLLGRPGPDHKPRDTSHVKNETGAGNEIEVDWRRSRKGREVLDEFREVTGERLRVLQTMSEADFDVETQTPIGPGPVRELLKMRIFDAWIHEQDIRRAVGIPGSLGGPVAKHSMGRFAMAMPFIVGKKAQASDGTSVILDVTGPAGRLLSIGVKGKRAEPLDAPPDSPTVRLKMDFETFACLGCGRWEPGEVLGTGKVQIDGDRALGETIVNQLNFMI